MLEFLIDVWKGIAVDALTCEEHAIVIRGHLLGLAPTTHLILLRTTIPMRIRENAETCFVRLCVGT